MPSGLRTALFAPLSPSEPGNGLAHRARAWQAALRLLGPTRTYVVPLAGDPQPGDDVIPRLRRPAADDAHLPGRAQLAPERIGRVWERPEEPFDLVVVQRAYLAPFVLGAVGGTACRVVVDLDDDDAALHDACGEPEEAERFRALVEQLRPRVDLLISVTGFGGTTAVPNSVPVPATVDRRPSDDWPLLLLIGNGGYAPNLEAAAWFRDRVLPRLRAQAPRAELAVVGPGTEVLGVHGRGLQLDLEPWYAAASVVLVPLQHGSGTRIKALEAFAHDVPVVGTTVGLEGLGVEDGVHALVRDSPDGFAEAVLGLLRDAPAGQALAQRARTSLLPRYGAEQVAADTAALLALVVERSLGRYVQTPRTAVTETDDGLVVLDEQDLVAHHLDPVAAVVFTLLEEPLEPDALLEEVSGLFLDADPATLAHAVDQALVLLGRAGLVRRLPGPAPD